VIVGNGDVSAVQFTERHFRVGSGQAHGLFQMMLEYLLDHVRHALTAGVVEQRPLISRCIGNDHDRPAFRLQLTDRSNFVRIIEEKK
jgi:hypothetical protein